MKNKVIKKVGRKGKIKKAKWLSWVLTAVIVAITALDTIDKFFPVESAINNFLKLDENSFDFFNLLLPLIAIIFALILPYLKEIVDNGSINVRSLEVAFNDMFLKRQHFKNVKIFAYSAKNYIAHIKRHQVKIDHLQLLLKSYDSTQAWFMKDPSKVKKYYSELEDVLKELQLLVSTNQVKSLDIRFYNFDSYSHFGIFDSYFVSGLLLPKLARYSTVKISDVQYFGDDADTSTTLQIIESNEEFFDKMFEGSSLDSGILHQDKDSCEWCKRIAITTNKNHISEKFPSDPIYTTEELLLYVDFRPVSSFHVLLLNKYHVINIYYYIQHAENQKRFVQIINRIDLAVKAVYGEDQEILVFEQATSQYKCFEGTSLDHGIAHIILKPRGFDFLDYIEHDKDELVDFSVSDGLYRVQLNGLDEFKKYEQVFGRDYFFIWDYSKNICYVYFPRNNKSQYLRKVFFSGMSGIEINSLYKGKIRKDYYDWKQYGNKGVEFSEESILKYKAIGRLLQDGEG